MAEQGRLFVNEPTQPRDHERARRAGWTREPDAALTIASWNVNSVRQRLENLTAWLTERKPDIVCLQETKCLDEAFPREAVEDLGYMVALNGQKTFNGVALLSRLPLEDIAIGLPGDADDTHARFISALVSLRDGALRVASLYLPNGNPPDTEKYTYKLRWMDRLLDFARACTAREERLVLAGDYNVIPHKRDAANPASWEGDALYLPPTRDRFRTLETLGFTDLLRATTPDRGLYTFWDYQAGAWQKNNGIRIDHLLASPQAADQLLTVGIDKHVRGWEKPSDHVPIWARFQLTAA